MEGASSQQDLQKIGLDLRKTHWQLQSQCDYIPAGDFSFYNHVLDTSALLSNLPLRTDQDANDLDRYFQVVRE